MMPIWISFRWRSGAGCANSSPRRVSESFPKASSRIGMCGSDRRVKEDTAMYSQSVKSLIVRSILGLLVVVLAAAASTAQVIVPVTPANQLSVTVSTTVTFNSATGLYTYAYILTNAAASQQAAWLFAIQFNGPGDSPSGPAGWTFAQHDDRPIVSWAATETGPLPPDYVDDGNVPPSVYTIAPGASLSGFQLVSPNPPGNVPFYIQGETKLPQAAGDVGDFPLEG